MNRTFPVPALAVLLMLMSVPSPAGPTPASEGDAAASRDTANATAFAGPFVVIDPATPGLAHDWKYKQHQLTDRQGYFQVWVLTPLVAAQRLASSEESDRKWRRPIEAEGVAEPTTELGWYRRLLRRSPAEYLPWVTLVVEQRIFYDSVGRFGDPGAKMIGKLGRDFADARVTRDGEVVPILRRVEGRFPIEVKSTMNYAVDAPESNRALALQLTPDVFAPGNGRYPLVEVRIDRRDGSGESTVVTVPAKMVAAVWSEFAARTEQPAR